MKVLVTGRSGQLARSLAERAAARGLPPLFFTDRADFDLARPNTLRAPILAAAPDVIVSAAAFTDVERAEREPALADRVNGEAPGAIAAAATEIGARIVHISTDYVFDGTGGVPIDEGREPRPINAYGRSKLAGELAVRAGCRDHLILRTAWLYGTFGSNFISKIVASALHKSVLRVVDDQIGSPTSALDLGDAILAISARWARGGGDGLGRTYHVAGGGSASWADLAREALSLAGSTASVARISTAEHGAIAPRPAFSVLDSRAFAADFGHVMPDWQASLAPVVERLRER